MNKKPGSDQSALPLLVCLMSTLLSGPLCAADGQSPKFVGDVEVDLQYSDPVVIQRFDHQHASITIDGHLDEPAWATPPDFREMRVIEPDTLAVPPYKTEFRLFYTEKGLYASFDLEQPADTIVKRITVRDAFGVNRDTVSFTLDTSGEGRYAYWMELSLGDTQIDGTVKPERQYSNEWDGAWYGATQITKQGWSAEYFIPWSQMAMPRVDGTRRIGLYFTRVVAHLDERWSWPPLPNSMPRFLSVLQPLEFEGVDPRKQWSLFPFASASYDRVDETMRYKAGFDVFWRPSSNFQMTGTVNPDFGAVEADNVVVNLTADETFFPEKRLFFLEGKDIFNTSPRAAVQIGDRLTVVNTRRIGSRPIEPELPVDVSLPTREKIRPSDLLGAAKLTGQLGRVRYGILAAMEDESDFLADDGQLYFQDGRDFSVVRFLYEDDHDASYRGLGLISTLVAHTDGDATVHGVDFHRLSSNGAWKVDGQLLHSKRDGTGSGYGGFVDVRYSQRQGLNHTVQLTTYDDKLDINDLGFQVRNDYSKFLYKLEWLKSDFNRIRNSRVGPFFRYAENGEGYMINFGGGGNIDITMNNLHSVNIDLTHFPEKFNDRDSFGNGTFEVAARTRATVRYRTNPAKSLNYLLWAERDGEALGGHAFKYGAGLTWRPRHNLNFHIEAGVDDRVGWLLHQEDRNFTTFSSKQRRINANFDYFPSATQQFRLILQWVGLRALEDEFFRLEDGSTKLMPGPKPPGETDDFSISELNFQVRYRWQIAPLSDLFVVYTKADSRETTLNSFKNLFEDSWNQPLGDQLVVKLRYRLGS
jgi:hypothetical protein